MTVKSDVPPIYHSQIKGMLTGAYPYTKTLADIAFVGTLYIPLQHQKDAWVNGAWAGTLKGNHSLGAGTEKSGMVEEACTDNGEIMACLRLDREKRQLSARLCQREENGSWECGDWQIIYSWGD